MLVILQNHDIQKTCRVCLKCICESRFADFENLLHLYENIAQVKVNYYLDILFKSAIISLKII